MTAETTHPGELLWCELDRMCEETFHRGRTVVAVRMNEPQRTALGEWLTGGRPPPEMFGLPAEPTRLSRIIEPHSLAIVDVLDGEDLSVVEAMLT